MTSNNDGFDISEGLQQFAGDEPMPIPSKEEVMEMQAKNVVEGVQDLFEEIDYRDLSKKQLTRILKKVIEHPMGQSVTLAHPDEEFIFNRAMIIKDSQLYLAVGFLEDAGREIKQQEANNGEEMD